MPKKATSPDVAAQWVRSVIEHSAGAVTVTKSANQATLAVSTDELREAIDRSMAGEPLSAEERVEVAARASDLFFSELVARGPQFLTAILAACIQRAREELHKDLLDGDVEEHRREEAAKAVHLTRSTLGLKKSKKVSPEEILDYEELLIGVFDEVGAKGPRTRALEDLADIIQYFEGGSEVEGALSSMEQKDRRDVRIETLETRLRRIKNRRKGAKRGS